MDYDLAWGNSQILRLNHDPTNTTKKCQVEYNLYSSEWILSSGVHGQEEIKSHLTRSVKGKAS